MRMKDGGKDIVELHGGSLSKPRAYLHWITNLRILLSIMLVYYHNMRFFDGRQNLVRVKPLPFEEHQCDWIMERVHDYQRIIVQVGLNMFFMLAGFSALTSLRSRVHLMDMARERLKKLIVAFVVGSIITGIPVAYTVILCKGFIPSRMRWNTMRAILLKAPGPMYFLPYLFLLWIFHTPYLITIRALVMSPNLPRKHAVGKVRAWMHYIYACVLLCLWLNVGVGVLAAVVWYIIARSAKLPFTQTYSRMEDVLHSARDGKLWMGWFTLALPMGALLWAQDFFPSIVPLTLSNAAFSPPTLVNTMSRTALVCLYVVPLVFALSFGSLRTSSRWFTWCTRCNASVLVLGSVVCGHALLIMAPHVFTPNKEETTLPSWRTTAFGMIGVPAHLQEFALELFYTGLSHSGFYVFAFLWLLLEPVLPDVRPTHATLVGAAIVLLLLASFSFPPREGFVFLGQGFVVYKHRWNRFWYWFGSWSLSIIMVSGAKHWANYPPSSSIMKFLKDSTFGLFLWHRVFEYAIACYTRNNPDTSFAYKMMQLNVGTFLGAYACTWITQRIPGVGRLFAGSGGNAPKPKSLRLPGMQ